jgi:membrane protein implicated in regulation of membrane protease activity
MYYALAVALRGDYMPETSDFSLLPLGLLGLLIIIFLVLCVWAASKIAETNQKLPLKPREKLINQLGRVISPVSTLQPGKIHVFGEIWDALSADPVEDDPIARKTEVRVVGVDAVNSQILRVTRLVR